MEEEKSGLKKKKKAKKIWMFWEPKIGIVGKRERGSNGKESEEKC